jgi:hypothetical protein
MTARQRAYNDRQAAELDKRRKSTAAQREVEGTGSPFDLAQDVLADFQNGPKIQRPSTAQSFIPVIGPAWEAVADVQDGNYGRAALNTAFAIGDALPAGPIVRGVKAASKGIGVLKTGSVTSGAAIKKIRKAGLAGKGEEVHHTVPLKGKGRSEQDWRNHYALLKTLPKETHRRLHGSWNGKPKFGLAGQLWHGTTNWQKTGSAAIGSILLDAGENLTRPRDPTRRTTKPR